MIAHGSRRSAEKPYMNDLNTSRGMDRADTGQWRLVIYITRTSLEAWLQPLADRQASRRIVRDSWEPVGDGPDLLARIENTVYDHPQLLDDYSADIIIETDRAMWVPSEVGADEERSEEVFNAVYGCEPEDMMADRVDDKTLLWWLTPGLPAFLSRTVPGARVSAHLGVIVSYLDRLRLPEGEVEVLNTRPGSCDVILLKDGELQTASTQRAGNPEEGIYRLLRASEVYGFSPRSAHIAVRDESGDDSALSEALDSLNLDASILVEEERQMPTAALLMLSGATKE